MFGKKWERSSRQLLANLSHSHSILIDDEVTGKKEPRQREELLCVWENGNGVLSRQLTEFSPISLTLTHVCDRKEKKREKKGKDVESVTPPDRD